jgi:nucleoside-diphosphate-sugar epimerase
LGTGKATPLLEVAELIYELAGRGGRPLPGQLPSRPGEATLQVAAVARSRACLDWQATTTLRQGLQRLKLEYIAAI